MVSSQGETSVPQGSILGPFFFLRHINDISVTQFADDASLFSLIYHAKTVYELNKDLQKKKKIDDCEYQWKVSLNPDLNDQAQEVIFSRSLT